MNHRLFVAEEVVPQSGILFEGLPDPRDVPMPKNSQASFEEPVLLAVSLGVLIFQERKEGLGHGQANCHAASLRRNVIDSRIVAAQEYLTILRKE